MLWGREGRPSRLGASFLGLDPTYPRARCHLSGRRLGRVCAKRRRRGARSLPGEQVRHRPSHDGAKRSPHGSPSRQL